MYWSERNLLAADELVFPRPRAAALDTSDWKYVVRRDDPPRGGVQ
jgi:hypothetical protein